MTSTLEGVRPSLVLSGNGPTHNHRCQRDSTSLLSGHKSNKFSWSVGTIGSACGSMWPWSASIARRSGSWVRPVWVEADRAKVVGPKATALAAAKAVDEEPVVWRVAPDHRLDHGSACRHGVSDSRRCPWSQRPTQPAASAWRSGHVGPEPRKRRRCGTSNSSVRAA